MIGRLLLAALLATACSSPPPAPAEEPVVRAKAPPTPEGERGELVDEAVVISSVHGKRVAREHYSIHRSASGYALASELQFSAGELAGVLLTDSAFRPEKGTWQGKVDGKPSSIDLARTQGGKLQKTSRVGDDEQVEVEFGAPDLYIAGKTAAHLAAICLIAGEGAGEKVAFPGVPLTYSAPTPLEIDGKTLAVRQVDIAALFFTLACEGGKLRGLHAPRQGLVAVREGDDALAAALQVQPRPKPPLPDTVVELPRRVKGPADSGLGDVELSCSLLVPKAYAEGLPKRGKKLPAVVFVTASGPQDRDDDSVGVGGLRLALFRTLAIALGEAGIASLRCDDPGAGLSTGDFRQGTRQSFTALVVAEVAALRGEAMVDPARIGVVGHSEGGSLAALVATLDPKLRALVLLAAPARQLEPLLIEQLEMNLRRRAVDPATIAREVEKAKRVFAAWRAGVKLPADLPEAERAAWEEQAPWLQSYLDHDPLAVAAKLGKIAVLVAHGEADLQVPVGEADLLAAGFARAGHKKAEVKRYPGLNHLFFQGKTDSLYDYVDPAAAIDAGFLADAVAFLKKNL